MTGDDADRAFGRGVYVVLATFCWLSVLDVAHAALRLGAVLALVRDEATDLAAIRNIDIALAAATVLAQAWLVLRVVRLPAALPDRRPSWVGPLLLLLGSSVAHLAARGLTAVYSLWLAGHAGPEAFGDLAVATSITFTVAATMRGMAIGATLLLAFARWRR